MADYYENKANQYTYAFISRNLDMYLEELNMNLANLVVLNQPELVDMYIYKYRCASLHYLASINSTLHFLMEILDNLKQDYQEELYTIEKIYKNTKAIETLIKTKTNQDNLQYATKKFLPRIQYYKKLIQKIIYKRKQQKQ